MKNDDGFYYERRFLTSRDGIVHLIIEIMLPLIPVIVYLIKGSDAGVYYYVLIITVAVPFLYEFIRTNANCSGFLKIENFITILTMVVMVVWDFIMIVLWADRLSEEVSSDSDVALEMSDFILAGLFVVPVIVTVIEVCRAFVFEYKQGELKPSSENIVDGAGKV